MDLQKQKDVYFLMGQLFGLSLNLPQEGIEIDGFDKTETKIVRRSGLVKRVELSKGYTKAIVSLDTENELHYIQAKKKMTLREVEYLNSLLSGEEVSIFDISTRHILLGKHGGDPDGGGSNYSMLKFHSGNPLSDGFYGSLRNFY